jgi:hypothetical protein
MQFFFKNVDSISQLEVNPVRSRLHQQHILLKTDHSFQVHVHHSQLNWNLLCLRVLMEFQFIV